MASKQLMHSESAQSAQCKRNVHTQEILRRLLNSSARLSWANEVAPVITEYMGRLKSAGYSESFRKQTLLRALRIFDHMKEDDREGVRPLFRPKDWQVAERRRDKQTKKAQLGKQGGTHRTHICPLHPWWRISQKTKKYSRDCGWPGRPWPNAGRKKKRKTPNNQFFRKKIKIT